MKTLFRLTLVTMTVGGGFAGIAMTLPMIFSTENRSAAVIFLMGIILALYAFVVASGLIYVQNPQRTGPLIVAFLLQVPWISSPLLVYKFTAGFQITAALIGGHPNGGFRIGSDFLISLLRPLPWGAGVNLVALAILFLLVWSELRTTEPSLEPAEPVPAR